MCIYLFVYVCTLNVGAIGSQKRELGLLELELQVVVSYLCGCCEASQGPLQEQYALLATETSFQPLVPQSQRAH